MPGTMIKVSSVIAVCLSLLPGAGALADSQPVAGYVAGTQKELGSFALAGGNVAKRFSISVSVISDDPTHPFHLASQDCFATYVFTAEGAPVTGKGGCDGISVGGDLWWISIELRPDGLVNWTNLGGTGRFAKITASGTTTVSAEFADGKVIGRFEGTYATD